MNTLVTFNAQRALVDFDNDSSSVAEVLLAFLEDVDASLSALEDAPAGGRDLFVAVLHELANSLDSIWCFDGGRRVREIEKQCRGDAPMETAAIQQEVNDIMQAAAEQARIWLCEHFA